MPEGRGILAETRDENICLYFDYVFRNRHLLNGRNQSGTDRKRRPRRYSK